MLSKATIKYWLRSRSLRFTLDRDTRARARPQSRYVWRRKPIYYRPGTSDIELIYKVLLKSGSKAEYSVPNWLKPRVVLDIGGNIGIASIYFAYHFPEARVYSFEPVPDNVALLRKNTAPYPNIQVCPVALGADDGGFDMNASDDPHNFGGFSFFEQGSDTQRKLRVEQRNPKTLFRELGVDQVDLIKIDTEGAEYDILTAFDQDMLRRTTWITGELHGEKDFELLAFLSPWFEIAARKTMGKRLFMFTAVNRSMAERL